MNIARMLPTLAFGAALFAASAAPFAAAAADAPGAAASAVPQVVIIAKRPTMSVKIRMALEDVRDAAKRLAGMQSNDGATAQTLG